LLFDDWPKLLGYLSNNFLKKSKWELLISATI
jgi:hypothetical protein